MLSLGVVIILGFGLVPQASAHSVPDSLKPQLFESLIKDAAGPGFIDVTGIYAVPEYWHIQGLRPEEYGVQVGASHVFLVTLTVHSGVLPGSGIERPDWASISLLKVDRAKEFKPITYQYIQNDVHHQVVALSFQKQDSYGKDIINKDTRLVELYINGPDEGGHYVIRWTLPVAIAEDSHGLQYLGWIGVLPAVFGGLLVYLSPCFLELTGVYVALISGIKLREISKTNSEWSVRRKVVSSSVLFVSGFTALYTVAGYLAGLGGEVLQNSFLNALSFPFRFGGGAFMVFLGLQSAGIVPKIIHFRSSPIFPRVGDTCRVGGSFLVGLSFGCLQSFRASIVTIMLYYAWAIGSALQGALILLMLSLSFGIPFIFYAAFSHKYSFASRIAPKMNLYMPKILAAFMLLLGSLMITDAQHPLLDLLDRLLPGSLKEFF